MVAYFRQFLVILLVLLQVAAPLVHAHVGEDTSQLGLHMHEFEILHVGQDLVTMTATDREFDSQSAIVNIGSAIKQQSSADNWAPVWFAATFDANPAISRQVDGVFFYGYSPHFTSQPFPRHNTSRAPPLS